MVQKGRSIARALAVLALVTTVPLSAATVGNEDTGDRRPTFTADVLPILQENCQVCHRSQALGVSGMVAPMPLLTYEDVRPWAKSIARVVQEKVMPPWSASEHFRGVFENERYLTDEEVATLVRWSRTGAAAGDAADAPPPVEFPEKEWWLGEPDLVLPLPEPIWVGDEVEDWQPMVQIPLTAEMLPEDRWLKAIECKPGSGVVHHIVVYAQGEGLGRDRGEAGVGGNLGGLAPGAQPDMLREGYGILLKKSSTLAISMHYHKEPGPGTGVYDQSVIGLHFYPEGTPAKNVQISPIGNLGFEIPPGHPSWQVGMSRTFDRPVTLLSMLPHMHFRGAAARYVAYYPDGREEVLLDVPRYDYAWQHSYRFVEPRQLPAGSRIDVTMWFDNSVENPANPDPMRAVRFGGPTTDEMALGWLYYTFDDEKPSPAGGYVVGGGE